MPDAILFDADNTHPYDPAHKAAREAVMKKVTRRFSISEEDFNKAYEDSRKRIKKRLGSIASSHSRLLYMQAMLENIGLGSQILIALDLEQTYWRTFLSNALIFKGVKEFLEVIILSWIHNALVTVLN